MNKVALLDVTKSSSFFPGGINARARFSGSVLQVDAASRGILIDLVMSLVSPSLFFFFFCNLFIFICQLPFTNLSTTYQKEKKKRESYNLQNTTQNDLLKKKLNVGCDKVNFLLSV